MPLTMEETPQLFVRCKPCIKPLFGQEKAFRTLKMCLGCDQPLDVLLLGQAGVGKLTAAKNAFEDIKTSANPKFSKNAQFVVTDALADDRKFYSELEKAEGGALFLRNADKLCVERASKLIRKNKNTVLIASSENKNSILPAGFDKKLVKIDFELLRVSDIKHIIEESLKTLSINARNGAVILISQTCQDACSAVNLLLMSNRISKSRNSPWIEKKDVHMAIKLANMEPPFRIKKPEIGEALALGVLKNRGCVIPVEVKFIPGEGVWINESAGAMARDAARSAYFAVNEMTGGAISSLKAVFNIKGGGNVDGPSLGLTLASSMISLIKGIPIKSGIAMTGEVSLSGKVLPVGGVDIKASGACLWGVKRIWLPSENAGDAIGRGAVITKINSIENVYDLI